MNTGEGAERKKHTDQEDPRKALFEIPNSHSHLSLTYY